MGWTTELELGAGADILSACSRVKMERLHNTCFPRGFSSEGRKELYLWNCYGRCRGLELVEEELEVADDNKLALPALLHTARLRHLYIPAIGIRQSKSVLWIRIRSDPKKSGIICFGSISGKNERADKKNHMSNFRPEDCGCRNKPKFSEILALI